MADMILTALGGNFTTNRVFSIISSIALTNKPGRYMPLSGMSNSAGRTLGPAVGSLFLYPFFSDSVALWAATDMFVIV